MRAWVKGAAIAFCTSLALGLSACISDEDGGTASGGGNLGGGGGTGGGQQATYSFGAGSGGSHQPGMLNIPVTNLSAGGSTNVSGTVVDQNGTPYTGSAQVTFISDCVSQGLATMDSPVQLSAGTATTTYTATGCNITDTITATVTVEGQQLQASGTITVAPPELGAIEFVSADPTTMSVRGSGLNESSVVTFLVTDRNGNPLPGQEVNFSLDTTVGGLSLTSSTATSGSDGQVSTTVQAGTVPTPVTVVATVTGTGISAASRDLSVGTAIPDSDSFSLSVSSFAPAGALVTDGVTVDVNINMADRFNNSVPDGTAVNFITEGGRIESSCTTANSACTAVWTSQDPRPGDGRVTILAYTIGEESFDDSNGDFIFQTGSEGASHDNLAEPFLDANENGVFDAGTSDRLIDTDQNGVRTPADNLFNGLLCEDTNGGTAPDCPTSDSDKTITIYDSLVIVMTSKSVSLTADTASIDVSGGGSQTVTFTVGDGVHPANAPPEGTTYQVEITNGEILSGEQIPAFDGGTPNAYQFLITVGPDGTPSSDGNLKVTATPPGGAPTSVTIPVTD